MSHIHVKDNATGHEYVVSERLFKPELQTETGKPARDRHGDLAPMKPKTTVAKKAAAKKKSGHQGPASSGLEAETEKE